MNKTLCRLTCVCMCLQQLLKDPKVSLAVLNPYVKRSIKAKSLASITAKEKFSPLTANLMSECGHVPSWVLTVQGLGLGLRGGSDQREKRTWCPRKSKEGISSPETGVVGGHELTYGCWELSLGSLQEQLPC